MIPEKRLYEKRSHPLFFFFVLFILTNIFHLLNKRTKHPTCWFCMSSAQSSFTIRKIIKNKLWMNRKYEWTHEFSMLFFTARGFFSISVNASSSNQNYLLIRMRIKKENLYKLKPQNPSFIFRWHFKFIKNLIYKIPK